MLQYAFNLFSHNSPMTDNGYNEEEMKMVKETRKILSAPDMQVWVVKCSSKCALPTSSRLQLGHASAAHMLH